MHQLETVLDFLAVQKIRNKVNLSSQKDLLAPGMDG